ncbi:hypothetical protein [Virgibacillus sp. DJP39]|uniref:hypothetical protein n=1 Tax=Virgibacillus sp. DJP39 TaxID=3409790 RepID=UPI003BB7139B
METVNANSLEKYINAPVEVCIQGRASEDQAPWVKRKVSKVTLCPDETHLRIYFDKHFFFAVPLTSNVDQKEDKWTAYDESAKLYYSIKMV